MKHYGRTYNIGWSFSRYNTFSTCKRQYYYSYYGKWKDDAVARLYNLESYAILKGKVTHKVLEQILEYLKRNPVYPIDKLPNHMDVVCRRIMNSAEILEVYYSGADKDELEGRVRTEIEGPIRAFIASERFNTLASQSAEQKAGWLIEPGDYGETRVAGLKMYAKADFIYQDGGKYIILDWKTGKLKTDEYAQQLLGYTVFVCDHFGVSPDNVEAYICHLGEEYSEHSNEFTEFDISEMAAKVEEQIGHMEQYCDVPERNFAKDISEFPIEENNLCGYCNYRELCGLGEA